jgi:hypothetical protein
VQRWEKEFAMMQREGEFWREFEVAHTITLVVPIRIEAGRLRVKQMKNNKKTYYVNFANGIFLTQAVLDKLRKDRRVIPHSQSYPSKKHSESRLPVKSQVA